MAGKMASTARRQCKKHNDHGEMKLDIIPSRVWTVPYLLQKVERSNGWDDNVELLGQVHWRVRVLHALAQDVQLAGILFTLLGEAWHIKVAVGELLDVLDQILGGSGGLSHREYDQRTKVSEYTRGRWWGNKRAPGRTRLRDLRKSDQNTCSGIKE